MFISPRKTSNESLKMIKHKTLNTRLFPEKLITGKLGWQHRIEVIPEFCSLLGQKVWFGFDGSFLTRYAQNIPGKPLSRLDDIELKDFSENGFRQVKQILSFAHGQGLPHGDVRAQNIIWDGANVQLLDWEASIVVLRNGIVRPLGYEKSYQLIESNFEVSAFIAADLQALSGIERVIKAHLQSSVAIKS